MKEARAPHTLSLPPMGVPLCLPFALHAEVLCEVLLEKTILRLKKNHPVPISLLLQTA